MEDPTGKEVFTAVLAFIDELINMPGNTTPEPKQSHIKLGLALLQEQLVELGPEQLVEAFKPRLNPAELN